MTQHTADKTERISCSVIIRTKNRPRHLYRSLESVRDQERKPDEVIVVNDGGESIESVLESYADLPLVYIANKVSLGRSDAGNAGVAAASGDAVCFLDDDDRFFPDHLKRLELCMLRFDAKIAYSGSRLVLKDLLGETEPEQAQEIGEFNDPFNPERLSFENYIPLNTLLINRDLFLEAGGFDPSFNLFEDWDLLLRLSQKTSFYHLNRVTSEYAVWGKSQQITLSSKADHWHKAYARMFTKHFINLPDEEKIIFMADYWILSQERRARVQELERSVSYYTQNNQISYEDAEKENAAIRNSLQCEIDSLKSALYEQKCEFDNAAAQREKSHIRKLDALKSALKLQKDKKKRLNDIIDQQNRELAMGIQNNDIRSILNAQYSAATHISSDILKDNYDRLVQWVKSRENRNLNEKTGIFLERWHNLEKELELLEGDTQHLLNQLHGSKLRRVWRGIPIPQVTYLLHKNRQIRQLISDTPVDVIGSHSYLLPPKNREIAEQDSIQEISGYTPVFKAFAGTEKEPQFMNGVDAKPTHPIALRNRDRLSFSVSSTSDDFFCLKIMLATYMRINTCSIRFCMFEDTSEDKAPNTAYPLRSCEFNAIDVLDNQYHTIIFPPVSNSKGKVYRVELDSPNATDEQHIAVWCSDSINNCAMNCDTSIQNIFHEEYANIYPWLNSFLSGIPLPNLFNMDIGEAEHLFFIYNQDQGVPSGFLAATLLQLSAMAGKTGRSIAVLLYGVADEATQLYCKKNYIKYIKTDQFDSDCQQLLPWLLKQVKESGSKGLVWFFNSTMRPGNDLIENVEQLLNNFPDTGIILPMVEDDEKKISHAFGQITREGNINTFPVGMDAAHPSNGYVREVDAAEAPFFVIHAGNVLNNLPDNFLEGYSTVRYQMTELIWRLKEVGVTTRFEPAVGFIGKRFEDKVSYDILEQDRLSFFKKWKSRLFYKSSAYDDLSVLLNPEKKNRVLLIDHTLPTFDEDSGSLRMYEILRLLIRLGFKVTFLPDNLDNSPKYKRALECLGIEVFCGDYGISDALAGRQYDIIILSRVDVGQRYMNLVKLLNPRARIYYDTVDIHYVRELRQSEIEGDASLYKRAVKTRQKELSNCIMADVVFTVTEEDKRHLLKEIPLLNCFVLPNIHRQLHFDISWESTDGLVFIGNYNHTPNEDAVFYFVENVFPIIKARIPDIRLYLIGSHMRENMKALESESIKAVGWVEEVEPELVKRRVMVSYLRYGAGMKGKIGQAMSLGLPVVSTSIGAEGMGLKDGETVVVADDPDSFAERICEIYTDKKMWEKVSENSRNYIYSQYGTDAVGQRLKSFLDTDLRQNEQEHLFNKNYKVITDKIPAATLLNEQKQPISNINPYGNVPVALTRGLMISFQLTPENDLLAGIRVRLGTYSRTNTCHVTVKIDDFIHSFNTHNLIDNEYVDIDFIYPYHCTAGKPITIEMFSEDANDGNMVALWCSKKMPRFVDTLKLQPFHFHDTENPAVSIVIPVFNKALYTYNCLLTLEKCDPDIHKEIIIINNASCDETESLLGHIKGACQIINNSENQGFVKACRQGADKAKGKFILFLNNDTQVTQGWLSNMITIMENDPTVGITGSKLIYPDGRLQEAGGIIFNDASGWNYGRLEDPTDPRFDKSRAVDYCSGASLMIRKLLWEQLGGFDMRFMPAYYEDTDLCFAVRQAGYKVLYCHESEVIHHEGITAGTDITSGYKAYQAINHKKFQEKWQVALKDHFPPPPQSSPDEAAYRLESR